MAFAAHDAPEARDRKALARKLEQRIKKTGKRTEGSQDDHLEEIINEAVAHVHSHPMLTQLRKRCLRVL